MRHFKFRAWVDNRMGQSFDVFDPVVLATGGTFPEGTVFMQFTGFKNKNGEDVFEGDIFRIEEDDDENTMIYVVVVWVEEWAMFTTLRVEDEYPAYLAEGVDAIDETMFWTYTLEDIASPKHYPCGNIYQNPELIKA